MPRICDLEALPASTAGKVEIETLEEGREPQILDHLIRSAILTVFRETVSSDGLVRVLKSVDDNGPIDIGEDLPVATYSELADDMFPLADAAAGFIPEGSSEAMLASAMEFVLEGLHLAKRLNKDAVGGRAQYRIRT
ncbi:MAG: hypothetical protein V9F03_01705 [Microthrixaceae bacterium]